MKYLFAVLYLCVNFYANNANKLLVLPTVIENGLTDDESDLAMATAMLNSEKTKDIATISDAIIKEMSEKFNSSEWTVVIAIKTLYDANALTVRSQNKKILRFIHEKADYTVVKNEFAKTNLEKFAHVLAEALKANVTKGYVNDPNGILDHVINLVNNTLRLHAITACGMSGISGLLGGCYALIADRVRYDSYSYGMYGSDWIVTVGDENSHSQSHSWSPVNTNSVHYPFVAEFRFGPMYFNVIQHNQYIQ